MWQRGAVRRNEVKAGNCADVGQIRRLRGQGVVRGLAEDAEGPPWLSPLTDRRWCNPKFWGLEASAPSWAPRSRSSPTGSVCQGGSLRLETRPAGVRDLPNSASLLISSGSMKPGPSQDTFC